MERDGKCYNTVQRLRSFVRPAAGLGEGFVNRKMRKLLIFAAALAATAGTLAPVRGQAVMSCELSSTTAVPGSALTMHTFLQNAPNVRGYQTRIAIVRLSGTGTLTVPCPGGNGDSHVSVNTSRPDYIFFGLSSTFTSTNCPGKAAGAIYNAGSVTVGATPAYLSTYGLEVSPDAAPGSTFQISIEPYPLSSIGVMGGGFLPFTADSPCILTVEASESLIFDLDFCTTCVPTSSVVRVPLRVSGLMEPVNGVQALFSYDPLILTLTGATVGDQMGSPWDAASLVYLNGNSGNGVIAVALNGSSSQADATVATLLFDAIGPGETSVDFRTASPPFATKITSVTNEVIVPNEIDSPTIISGNHSKGDVNGDGQRDGLDVQQFVDTILNPGAATAGELCAGDLSGDGSVTEDQDVPLFVDCLINEICVCQ